MMWKIKDSILEEKIDFKSCKIVQKLSQIKIIANF